MSKVTVGVSLKTYFGHERAREWFGRVAELARAHDAVRSGEVELFVIPSYVAIPAAVEAFASTGVVVGAQDVSEYGPGAYTGEVTAEELAEVGVGVVEIGHAERRHLFGETDDVVASKTAAALRNGLTPVLCIGETERGEPVDAAEACLHQLSIALTDAPDGRVIVAYEPVWAIGAAEPAAPEYIAEVSLFLRTALAVMPGRDNSVVIYGGSAGPGLLGELAGSVDGLFLGRFAHDTDALEKVLDEAAELAS